MEETGRWVTASDLAEYAFCPRAHWYRLHPPREGETASARDRATAGSRYHRRVLGDERRRAEHPGAYWTALAVGLVLVVGGTVWLFHP